MSAVDLSVYEPTLNTDLNGDGITASLRTTIGTHVYDLVLTPTTWDKAKAGAGASKYVKSDGKTVTGALVSIDDTTEKTALDAFIASFANHFTGKSSSTAYFWTSANDTVKKGTWKWGDNASLLSTDTNWASVASKTSTTTTKTYVAEAVENNANSTVLIGQYNNLAGTEKLAYVVEYAIA